ncbi:MAG: DUF1858 domain-containing protein [Syntrophorhabdaceae bacterium]|nr:DUF1858 domain-containing protein [Syntrophorhabdaceae bacterium]
MIIDKDMSIEELIKLYPEIVSVFKNYGLECAGCKAALFKNIEEGAYIFNINLDALLSALNKAVNIIESKK